MNESCMRLKGVLGDDCQRELDWAASRPTSRRKSFLEQHPEVEAKDLQVSNPLAWATALNEMEYRFLEQYQRAWPDTAYQLNQDPSSGHGHHADKQVLFTLISNFGLVWHDGAKRWLMPTEALVCQRFPVLPYIHDGLELTTFNTRNESRNARHVCSQVGNSMHVGVMALLQLHSYAEIETRPMPCLFRNIKLARRLALNWFTIALCYTQDRGE